MLSNILLHLFNKYWYIFLNLCWDKGSQPKGEIEIFYNLVEESFLYSVSRIHLHLQYS